MADQFHVAHSTRVMGAGIFAAGPYLCAGADYPKSVFRALNVCSHFMPGPFLGPPEVQRSIAAARGASEAGDIDDLAGLRGDRVFLFSGRRDTLVPESVVDTVQTFYRAFDKAEDIALVSNVDAAHAMVTKAFGNACETSKAPFVNRCGYDLAGAALRHIYGPLAPPTEADGELVVFDQTEFVDPAKTHGLAERGYEYVPKGCTEHRGCAGCTSPFTAASRTPTPSATPSMATPATTNGQRRTTSSCSIRRRPQSPPVCWAFAWHGRTRKVAGTGGASPAQISPRRTALRSARSMR